MKLTTILAIFAVAVIAAVLVGITYAQVIQNQAPANLGYGQIVPPYLNGNTAGYPQGYYGYGVPQGSSQYQYGMGMMGRIGMGMHGGFW